MNITQHFRSITLFYFIITLLLQTLTVNAQLNQAEIAPTANDSILDPSLKEIPLIKALIAQNDLEIEEEEEEEEDEEEEDMESDSSIDSTFSIALIKTAASTTTTTTSTTAVALPMVTEQNNKTLQYTNTSDPLVQYDLECEADDSFCSKVSRAVGAAIDEFSRVIYVKNSLL